MSTDPSNNIIQEPPINNTPSMETQDYFQYIMNSTMNIEHDIDHMHPIQSTRRSNFISSIDNAKAKANDICGAMDWLQHRIVEPCRRI